MYTEVEAAKASSVAAVAMVEDLRYEVEESNAKCVAQVAPLRVDMNVALAELRYNCSPTGYC